VAILKKYSKSPLKKIISGFKVGTLLALIKIQNKKIYKREKKC